MKKKKIVTALCAVLAAVCLTALCACGLLDAPSYQNPYEAASEWGYQGTQSDWIASHSGGGSEARRLYDDAVAAGYSGSFLDFLQTYTVSVPQDDTAAVNRAMTSAVCIRAGFNVIDSDTGMRKSSVVSGAGVIYSLDKEAGDAYIITNYHVVYEAKSVGNERVPHVSDSISVYLYGGETEDGAMHATYVGGAMDYDIAVLEISGAERVTAQDSMGLMHTHTNGDVLKDSAARAIAVGNSAAVTVGERVYAMGNPAGDGFSVTGGIISVASEYINVTASDGRGSISVPVIRTDAAVNHGNSGGGLFNADGAFIGTVNARSEREGVVAFGYAIPSDVVLAITQNVLDNRASKGALCATIGVTVYTADSKSVFDEETQKAYVMETVVVRSVTAGSLSQGRLQGGDVLCSMKLTSAQGETKMETAITRRSQIEAITFHARKGDVLEITVSRGGRQVNVSLSYERDANFTLFD